MQNARYLDVIEAAYRSELSDEAWLAGLFDAVAPLIDMGSGVVGLRYEMSAAGGVELRDLAASSSMRAIESASRDYLDRSTGPMIERMFCRTDAMFLRRDAAGPPSDNPEDFEYWSTRGVQEAFSVVGYDPSGHGVMLTAMAKLGARMPAKKRELLRCVAAHIASALRFRKVSASAAQGDVGMAGGEAIVSLDGDVMEASPAIDSAVSRRAWADAGRKLGKAKSRSMSEEEAVGTWTALWAGRWTLVERQERGGRCYLLACRNAPNLAEPKALTERERQVLVYAQMGHSQKFIAFELGLAKSTVAAHMASGMRKLGIDNRVELTRFAFGSQPVVVPD